MRIYAQSIQGSQSSPLSRMSGVEIPSLHTSSSFIHPFENVVTRARFEQGPQKVHFRAASDLVMRLHNRREGLVSEAAQKEYEVLALKGNPLGDYLVAVAVYERSTLTQQAAPPLVVSKLQAAAKNGVLEAMEWLAFLSLFRLADIPLDEGYRWADKAAKGGLYSAVTLKSVFAVVRGEASREATYRVLEQKTKRGDKAAKMFLDLHPFKSVKN